MERDINNINGKLKRKGRLKRIFSKFLNFLCALIIFFVILFSIGAFMQADVQQKNILGNHDHQIFSYVSAGDGKSELIAFGESFIIDFNAIASIKERFDEVSAINKDYTPSLIVFGGDIISGCVASVGESLKKIPDIIKYFLE